MKYNNIFNLNNKTVVITGGAGLIGLALVRAFAEWGAKVVLADINKKKGKTLEKSFKKQNLNVIFRYLDITNESKVSKFIESLYSELGKIDVWINSAYPRTKDWGDKNNSFSVVSWKRNMKTHLDGYFICSKVAAEYMKKRKSGSIINFSSIYGIVAPVFSLYEGIGMTIPPAAYSAIKGGIIAFTRYFASYYGKYNIRINCISPGGVLDKQSQTFIKRYCEKVPLKRMAAVEDIVGAAIFLSSDSSRYITGHNLVVDGGWSIV